jgi:hypothetical protein
VFSVFPSAFPSAFAVFPVFLCGDVSDDRRRERTPDRRVRVDTATNGDGDDGDDDGLVDMCYNTMNRTLVWLCVVV